MPDVLEMIASNPEMAQSLDQGNAPQPQQQSFTVDPMTAQESGNFNDQLSKLPAVVSARMRRTANVLSDPDLQESMVAHHQAVADANALHHQASQELTYLHAAHTLHDTGAYYQEAHGISPSDPDFEQKMIGLGAKYPFAKPDGEIMRSLYDARRTFSTANSMIEERKQQDELFKAMGKGHLSANDLANPDYQINGRPNYGALRMLAASREAASQPLTTEEREILTEAGKNPAQFQKKVLNSTDDPNDPKYNRVVAGQKALFYRAQGKANGAGAAPAASPATPKSFTGF